MPDLGSLVLRNVKGSPLTFTEGDNNIQYAALQSQSVSYTTHYFQSNSLILSRSNGGGIEIKDLGTFTASYAMNARTASYALSASNITNYQLYATYSNYVTNSFTILSESVGRGGFFQFTGSFSITSSNGTSPQTASFYLPTTFYSDVTLSGSTTNIDGNLQVVTGDNFLNGIRIYRGEEPGVGFKQFLALNFANGNGNILAYEPQYNSPRMHFRLSSSATDIPDSKPLLNGRSLLSIEKLENDDPHLILGGTWFTAADSASYTSYFSGSAVFLAGATGSLRGTASGNFASASISSNTVTFFNGYNQTAGTLNLANSTNQNLQSVTSVGNSTTSSVNIGANNSSSLSSVAFGLNSIAVGSYSFSNGNTVSASGLYSHAEGGLSTAKGNYSHAEGFQTTTLGVSSHSEGESTTTIGNYSHAEGINTIASGSYSHAEGYLTIASGSYSHAEGRSTIASGSFSHAEGGFTIATNFGSHAEGYTTRALGDYTHAEGSFTTAIGQFSHAEGESTVAKNQASHAAGFKTTASADYQFVVGHGNIEQSNIYNTVGYRPFIVGGGNVTGPATNLLEVVLTKINGGSQNDGTIVLPRVSSSMNFPTSASAAANGVPLGGIYRNGAVLMIRI